MTEDLTQPPPSSPYSAAPITSPSSPPGHTTDPPTPRGMADPTYRRKRRKHTRPFNFEIDNPRRKQLKSIAAARGISQGATLRQLISAAYAMDVDGHPLCVSGRACFMPHMHPPVKAPHPTEDPSA